MFQQGWEKAKQDVNTVYPQGLDTEGRIAWAFELEYNRMKNRFEDEFKSMEAEIKRFKKAYEILNEYIDSISDEERVKVDKQLSKLKL